jgi:hypothetical protein
MGLWVCGSVGHWVSGHPAVQPSCCLGIAIELPGYSYLAVWLSRSRRPTLSLSLALWVSGSSSVTRSAMLRFAFTRLLGLWLLSVSGFTRSPAVAYLVPFSGSVGHAARHSTRPLGLCFSLAPSLVSLEPQLGSDSGFALTLAAVLASPGLWLSFSQSLASPSLWLSFSRPLVLPGVWLHRASGCRLPGHSLSLQLPFSQSPAFSLQRSVSSVQSPAFSLQRSVSSVQSPAFGFWLSLALSGSRSTALPGSGACSSHRLSFCFSRWFSRPAVLTSSLALGGGLATALWPELFGSFGSPGSSG